MPAFADSIKRFIESQLLDMSWLDNHVSHLLWRGGLDPASPLGATSQLLICNIVKLTILLIVLSFLRCVLHVIFAPERGRSSLFGGGVFAAFAGTVTGSALPKSAETTLPSHLAALVRRGIAPEAAAAILFTAPFADPFTALVALTLIFDVRSALVCVLSGGALAVAGGVLIGKISRQNRCPAEADAAPAAVNAAAAPSGTIPSWRDLPGLVLAEIRYVFPCIVLGAGSGAFISNWVPESWVQTLLGTDDLWAVCLAAAAGIPFSADLFTLLPIVIALRDKGAQPGVLTAFILSATAFPPSALFAFRHAAKTKFLLLIYVLCLLWAAGIGCLAQWFR